ncbi:MAG: glutamine synthetase type III, partial [Oscillibacter sp.]|nr:glutamine synthetase type III [Oscillibacter sp.]
NFVCTADALPMYTARKNVDLFVKHGIYTEEEIQARAEIHIENYSAVLSIEGRTMAHMLRRQILPAASAYADELCQRAFHKDAMGVSCAYERESAAEIGELSDGLYAVCLRLEEDLKNMPQEPTRAMVYCHEVMVPDMEEARQRADRLETLTARDRWPFPTYGDLLFSV